MSRLGMLEYVQQIIQEECKGKSIASFSKHSLIKEISNTHPGVKIRICFPGYKATATKPDYLVQLCRDGVYHSVSHDEIMRDLYDYVIEVPDVNGPKAEQFICSIYRNWENAETSVALEDYHFNHFTPEEMIDSICYIAIQEEINYPQGPPKYYYGSRRPFLAYQEAITAAMKPRVISLEDAIERCNSRRRFEPIDNVSYSGLVKSLQNYR